MLIDLKYSRRPLTSPVVTMNQIKKKEIRVNPTAKEITEILLDETDVLDPLVGDDECKLLDEAGF